ncbi:ABC transporter ATP-binding protein [Mangrovicoccus sp. HB161399]|uniref:ABC transporter ATP-binding protein n=1 Tax=Mangrovicoccus sp. HB161399 TaxID=2720392 RepID=UPI0015559806|nr:ABC transporter ATP-binding protein [Mangrovicoccus sp. HB161399]
MAHVQIRNVSKIYADGTPAVTGLDLDIAAGEFLCVLGPSGCGKSSTLRMLAGLEEVSTGQILVDGDDVVGRPARERDIAMVFENYALYPHLDVFANIAMPLVARRRPKAEIRDRVGRIAGTMGITEHLAKRPGKLSGGQRQRVSLARAMIRRPKMFLMDEPLGHLEEYMRIELRREIRALHEAAGGTTFYITHDQEEAAAVSDRIAVMSSGELQQLGTMKELIERPANRFVAEFVGEPPISIFEELRATGTEVSIGDWRLPLPPGSRKARPASAGVRPAHFRIAGSDMPGLSAEARLVQPMGESAAVLCDTPAGDATVIVPMAAVPREGDRFRLVAAPEHVHFFAASGRAIRSGED